MLIEDISGFEHWVRAVPMRKQQGLDYDVLNAISMSGASKLYTMCRGKEKFNLEQTAEGLGIERSAAHAIKKRALECFNSPRSKGSKKMPGKKKASFHSLRVS